MWEAMGISGIVQIDNIFLSARFSGLYLIGCLGFFCFYFYKGNSKKFNDGITSENTVGLGSWFALRNSREEMHLSFLFIIVAMGKSS